MSADDAVDAARRANAEKYSPYYWTRAIAYLHMSREVAAHADFQGANRFGRLAADAANSAREEAVIGAKDPSKLPYIDLSKSKAKDDAAAPAKDDKVAPAKAGKGIAPAKDSP
jgi:hypothetical protein